MVKLQSVFPPFVVLYDLFQSCLSVGPGNCNFFFSRVVPYTMARTLPRICSSGDKAGAAIGDYSSEQCPKSIRHGGQGSISDFLDWQ